MKFHLTIYENPIPKGRPRLGKGGRAYTPQRTRDWEELVGRLASAKWKGEPTTDRLSMSIRYWRKDRRKCDLTNLTKAIEDGLQGIVFVDDEQIDEQYHWKAIDRDNPRIEIHICTYQRMIGLERMRQLANSYAEKR